MVRIVQLPAQVQDPHGRIAIGDRRSVRFILATEPMAVDGIFRWPSAAWKIGNKTGRRA